jgi:hypothetical protein
MFDDEPGEDNLEEMLRSMARELGRSVERALDKVDLDDVADAIGVDPSTAGEWVENAGSWLRAYTQNVGDQMARRAGGPILTPTGEDALRGASPHPMDPPTEEQGLALAALDSGRWTIEPGTDALAVNGDGPGPSDALGVVRELRVRDWISADGEITVAGRRALSRWLAGTTRR